jgi:hypothetical protein
MHFTHIHAYASCSKHHTFTFYDHTFNIQLSQSQFTYHIIYISTPAHIKTQQNIVQIILSQSYLKLIKHHHYTST